MPKLLPICLLVVAVNCSKAGSSGEAGSGGNSASGGNTSAGSGGSTNSGGHTASGGSTAATGGHTGSGGATASGGSGSGGTKAGSGGSAPGTGSGGATSSGGSGGSADPLLGDVSFSTPSQSFMGTLNVGMTTAVSGAEIRYTTDGTLPTASSTMYGSTPLAITATTQVRAQPFLNGVPGGTVSTAIYLARTFTATSALPIILLDDYGNGASTDKDTYLDLAVMIYEPVNGMASLDGLPTIATRAGFHIRGQSSASFPQKSYKVELRDNADGDSKYPVIGMPADSDWDFIAPYYDRSLVRNPFIYSLARDMGRQAPRVQFAEVYVTTGSAAIASADYQGIYWITETLKINGHRVDLNKLGAADTTEPAVGGGYILEFNWEATDATKPQVMCTKPANAPTGYSCFSFCEVTDPSPLPANTEQLAYITNYVQMFHDTLFTTPLGDYSQYIDVGSFADDLIINELSRNIDAYRRSSYYYKDLDGMLNGGPFWDYNFALGVGTVTSISPTPVMATAGAGGRGGTMMGGGFGMTASNDPGWEYQDNATSQSGNVNSWFPKLMTDTNFVNQVKTRWKALRADLLSEASIQKRVSMLSAQLPSDAVARDAAKWPLGTVYGNTTGMTGSTMWVRGGNGIYIYGPPGTTLQAQVQAMQDFVNARATWMDSQWQ